MSAVPAAARSIRARPATQQCLLEAERAPSLPDIRQSERELIVTALGPSPVDIDELIRATGVENSKVHIVLLELDLAGRLQRQGSSSYRSSSGTALRLARHLVLFWLPPAPR